MLPERALDSLRSPLLPVPSRAAFTLLGEGRVVQALPLDGPLAGDAEPERPSIDARESCPNPLFPRHRIGADARCSCETRTSHAPVEMQNARHHPRQVKASQPTRSPRAASDGWHGNCLMDTEEKAQLLSDDLKEELRCVSAIS